MSREVEVSVEGVKTCADELRALVGRFSAAVRSFQAEIAAAGEPWGSDDLGSIIGTAHQAAYQGATDCFVSNSEELAGHAAGLAQAAMTYHQAEVANEEAVSRVNDPLR